MAPILFIVKTYLIPGSPMFLIVAIGVGLALLARPSLSAWGRRWLVAVMLSHAVLAVPVVSGWLQRGVGGTGAIRSAAEVGNARTIVVLGNGVVTVSPGPDAIDLPAVSTASNIAEAARLYRILGRPRVIASGGMPPGGSGERPEAEVMRPYLTRLGVAEADITPESSSTNTAEQARFVAAMLPRGTPIVLVTVPTHMTRSAALFRRQGLVVTTAVSDSAEARVRTWTAPLLPNRYALRGSELAIYELIALAYYGARGELN